jgi:flavorubredoxin
MKPIEVVKDVYWVGAIDYDVRNFHGYSYTTHHGTTYNAYLVIGEKIALVDAVLGSFSEEMLSHISEIIDPTKIDYMKSNHTEMNHSGTIFEVLKPRGKKAAAFGSYGWCDGATKKIQESMEKGKLDIIMDPFTIKWVPNEDELGQAYEFGREFARCVK